MSYKVEIQQTGRGGLVKYIEHGGELCFDWEFASRGADIFIPDPLQWDTYCRNHGAGWAEGKRQEILERVAQEVRTQKARNSSVNIEDNWIHFDF
jgi:hypothetical protein